MIIETGTIVFFSLIIMFWRMPKNTKLWLLGHPIWLELPFGLLAYVLHYGTFSGMMAAATAASMCFVFVQIARKLVSYNDGKQIITGRWRLE